MSSLDRDDPAYQGQREYTPLFLRIYDPVILGFLAPVVWRCPSARLAEGIGGTSDGGTSTWVRAPATSSNEPICLTAARSPSSTPT